MKALERALLALFPASFRRRFADDLRDSLRRALTEASRHERPTERLRRRGMIVADFVATAAKERLAHRRRGSIRPLLSGVGQDVRFACRQLRRSPGFTAAVMVTVALGVGINAGVFSVLYGAVLRPLPFERPERLVYLWGAAVGPENESLWAEAPGPLAATTLVAPDRMVVTADGPARNMGLLRTDARFADVLGFRPIHGRWFLAEEVAREEPVVLLRADEARALFGSSEAALGRTVRFDGTPHVVIGVVDPEVARSFRYGGTGAWMPLAPDARRFSVVGRLGSELEPGEVRTALLEIPDVAATPEPRHGAILEAEGLHEMVVGWYRSELSLLYAGVAVVLILACINVAHLFLVRADRRLEELAIRASLGAGRSRLVRQMLTEGALAAGLGGMIGLLLAPATRGVFVRLAPGLGTGRLAGHGFELPALVYGVGVTLLAGLVFGVVPALALRGDDLRVGGRSRGGGPSRGQQRFRSGLMVTQVALTLAALTAAGLLVRTFQALEPRSPGFDPSSKLTFQVWLPQERYPDGPDRQAFLDALLAELRGTPGITAAEAATDLPFTGSTMAVPVRAGGEVLANEAGAPTVHLRLVTSGYLDLLEMRSARGSEPGATDLEAAFINEKAARVLWPNQRALGRRFTVELAGDSRSFRVAGILTDARSWVREDAWPEVFLPYSAAPAARVSVVAATAGAPERMAEEAVEALARIDPLLPAEGVQSLESILRGSVRVQRFNATMMSVFAALTLALACIGIFGVMAHVVGARRREFGVRIALGATRRKLAALVLRRSLTLVGLGAALGLLVVRLGVGWLEAELYGVRGADPVALGAAISFLLAGAVTASAVPALRAARTAPAESLRPD